MRLDAARLKGVSVAGSRFGPVTRSNRALTLRDLKEPVLADGFFISGVHSTAPWISIQPLDPENVEFFALKPFSGQIAPFSRSKKPPRRPSRRADRARPQRGFGGVAPLNKA